MSHRAEKSVRSHMGADGSLSIPRDRKGEFEPKLLKKKQTNISQDIEENILSMYAKGMTTGDIEAHIWDIYCLEASDRFFLWQKNGSSGLWRSSAR